MLKIGKYKCLVDLQSGTSLSDSCIYFALEFEYDNKVYVDWTCENGATLRAKLYQLMYYSSKGSGWLRNNNPGLCEAFNNSKYVVVSTLKKFDPKSQHSKLYNELYSLIDEHSCYAPLGHNRISLLNKSMCEKEIIRRFAWKWGILPDIEGGRRGKAGRASSQAWPSRPVYEYKKVSGDTFTLYKKWNSVKEYAESMEPFKVSPSAIYMCCNGQRKVAYGSVWRYDDAEKAVRITDMRKCGARSAQASQLAATLGKDVSLRVAEYKAKQLKAEERWAGKKG